MNCVGLKTFGLKKQKSHFFGFNQVSNFKSGLSSDDGVNIELTFQITPRAFKVQHYLRCVKSCAAPAAPGSPSLLPFQPLPHRHLVGQLFSQSDSQKFTLSSSISAIKFSARTTGQLATASNTSRRRFRSFLLLLAQYS